MFPKKLETLIRKCKSLNRKAQRQMVDLYNDDLYNLCLRYVRDKDMAKDCLQESWIQIFWTLDKYSEQGKWESWIKTITINKCKEILRKNGKWTSSNLTIENDNCILNKEQQIISEETVNMFLDRLPTRYRMVVNLYLVEEYSHKEIAEFLEINESSSRSIYSRAMKKLRQQFREPPLNEKKTKSIISRSIFKQAII